jgi:hypothetical protein
VNFEGTDVAGRANTLQLATDQHGDAVAEHFSVGKNVGGEENRFALIFQFENDVADFAAADGIEGKTTWGS